MQFLVTYLFTEEEDGDVQTDIVEAQDKNSCREKYNSKEYKILEIEPYDEKSIELEMEEDLDSSDIEDIIEYDDNDFNIVFPNAETKEDLEEELEHTYTKMMDN